MALENMLEGRRQELREFEVKAEQARALGSTLEDMKADLQRYEKRQAAFAALGDRHVETPQSVYDQRYHTTIQMEPARSKLTGRELAAGLEGDVKYLKAQIAATEKQIKELLAQ
jgi:hypothetical protein